MSRGKQQLKNDFGWVKGVTDLCHNISITYMLRQKALTQIKTCCERAKQNGKYCKNSLVGKVSATV